MLHTLSLATIVCGALTQFQWSVFTFVYQALDNNQCGSFASDLVVTGSLSRFALTIIPTAIL